MNIAVRYYTRSGNTERLAKAVAQAVSAEALSVEHPLQEKADILFLGCSYYAFDIDPLVKEFLCQNKDSIGTIVCIGTSAMMKSMKKPVEKIANIAGLKVAEEEFHCRGEFKMFHKGKPDAQDLEDAGLFAQHFVESFRA